MTLRMDLAYVVLAALALLIADVAAAQAATKICDVMPWRCRYDPDGRNYYWTPDRHMPGDAQTSSHSAGTATTPQAWGCGAADGVARGRSGEIFDTGAASFRAP